MRITQNKSCPVMAEMNTPLRIAREARGLTIDEAALLVGTDQGNMSRIERGMQTPNKNLLAKIAEEFGLSELQILFPERYAPESASKLAS